VADITVEVSSAGLTAYGAGTWGSQSFGGDSITNVSIGTVEAFYPDEGWGGYYWGYLVWGQNFEDALVNVTTPTIQSSVGNENIEGDGNVFLSTNLLNLTSSRVISALLPILKPPSGIMRDRGTLKARYSFCNR